MGSDETYVDDTDHLKMLYPELVDRAMRSQEPITEVGEIGEYRRTYTAVQYDPNTEAVWRCYIDVDSHPEYDSKPSVHFSKCYPTSSAESMQKWTSLATGRLGGPQKLGPWESLFTVFNAALGLYNREVRDSGRTLQPGRDRDQDVDDDREIQTDGGQSVDGTERPETRKRERECPHCREWHEVDEIVEPGWERMVYCPRTGEIA